MRVVHKTAIFRIIRGVPVLGEAAKTELIQRESSGEVWDSRAMMKDECIVCLHFRCHDLSRE
jgi:hypothetical protein